MNNEKVTYEATKRYLLGQIDKLDVISQASEKKYLMRQIEVLDDKIQVLEGKPQLSEFGKIAVEQFRKSKK